MNDNCQTENIISQEKTFNQKNAQQPDSSKQNGDGPQSVTHEESVITRLTVKGRCELVPAPTLWFDVDFVRGMSILYTDTSIFNFANPYIKPQYLYFDNSSV